MSQAARACRICETRRPRRYCPGVQGDICPICCGTEREVTVACPLDCAYLVEARRREKEPDVDPNQFPNRDVKVDEAFLRRNEHVLILLGSAVATAALETAGVIDADVKQALDALVRTCRTLESGLVYESRPENPLAARIFSAVQARLADVRSRLGEHGASLRDADVLGVLVFLQHLEIQHNNGRPKGSAYIDFLRQFFPNANQRPSTGGIIHTA